VYGPLYTELPLDDTDFLCLLINNMRAVMTVNSMSTSPAMAILMAKFRCEMQMLYGSFMTCERRREMSIPFVSLTVSAISECRRRSVTTSETRTAFPASAYDD